MTEGAGPALEIVFREPLCKVGGGISPGGAIFPFEVITSYDPDKNMLVLREDYRALLDLQSETLFFRSDVPRTPVMCVREDKVLEIRELGSDKPLYCP
jgi:hypothetical protein